MIISRGRKSSHSEPGGNCVGLGYTPAGQDQGTEDEVFFDWKNPDGDPLRFKAGTHSRFIRCLLTNGFINS